MIRDAIVGTGWISQAAFMPGCRRSDAVTRPTVNAPRIKSA